MEKQIWKPQLPVSERVASYFKQKFGKEKALEKDKKLDLESPRFQKAFSYIENFRLATIRTQSEDDKETGAIGLGETRFLVPNTDRFGVLFYWDSYFMMQPLVHSEEGRDLAKSTIEAFSMLLDKEGFIPNASTNVFLNSSQAPFYSSMILDTYLATPLEQQNPEWLKHYMDYAKYEYSHVWNNENDFKEGKDGIGSFHHYLPQYGLSKYGDRDGDYSMNAERESGWDFTSRFGNVAVDYLPIDLNCFLYKYEMDFAKAAELLGNLDEQGEWLAKAEARKQRINTLMWNEEKGFFFDYNYATKEQGAFYSLAPFTALWCGLATPEQAKRMIEQLPRFNQGKGLMVTDKASLPVELTDRDLEKVQPHYRERVRRSLGRKKKLTPEERANEEITGKQWDYPHVWAPIESMVVKGILQYAKSPALNKEDQTYFRNTAKELMEDYLVTMLNIFEEENSFPEKSNGITGKAGNGAHYKKQKGFGWTCAIFEEFGKYILPQIYDEEAKEKQFAKSRRSLVN